MPNVYDDSGQRPGLLSIISLVLAIAALALAGWTFYKTEFVEESYSPTQIADAKVKACAAVDVVRRGVSLNTNLAPAGGPGDVTGSQAVAANARVSLYDGGQYLLERIDPATPSHLADTARTFANNLMDIGANATAGSPNDEPAQAARLKDADAANATLAELCK
jgi:hypothetical protein